MEKKEWNVGDRVYRYGFDPKKDKVHLDVFELTDISPRGDTAKYKDANNSGATLGNGVHLGLATIGTVYTSGSTRFILLKEEDYWKARKLLAAYISRRRESINRSLEALNAFENWLSSQNERTLD